MYIEQIDQYNEIILNNDFTWQHKIIESFHSVNPNEVYSGNGNFTIAANDAGFNLVKFDKLTLGYNPMKPRSEAIRQNLSELTGVELYFDFNNGNLVLVADSEFNYYYDKAESLKN